MALVPAPLADAVVAAAARRRVLLGIGGGPGSGKSTLAADLAAQWSEHGAVVVPMDGFHLGGAQLAARGLSDRKGSPESFDALGFAALLAALRGGTATAATAAPAYSRELHEPVPGAISIPSASRIVIAEGNYLGVAAEPWPQVRTHLDWLWRLDVPWEVARERLVARRIATGRSPGDAETWVDAVDAPNAALVAASDADAVLEWAGSGWRERVGGT